MAQAAGCDRAGLATLALGRVDVAAPLVTANSIILLTPQSGAAPLALPWVSGRTPGTGFTITSLNLTDTATVAWFMIEPG